MTYEKTQWGGGGLFTTFPCVHGTRQSFLLISKSNLQKRISTGAQGILAGYYPCGPQQNSAKKKYSGFSSEGRISHVLLYLD